ncbi:MAG TPA: YciI family protein [Patescibacteria group bacterium]|nr:YciI family protein [Patescibacteria group bacterium]
MLFVIIGHDGPDGAAIRPKVREAHLANLRTLKAGRLRLAGPFTDGSGSLIIVDMENEAEALAFAHSDPYVTSGVFARVEVKPFRQVFPEPNP